MKLGVTSFGFRHLMLDRSRAPSLVSVVERAATLGFESLQICENAYPLELSQSDWEDVKHSADRMGIEIQLGCKTRDLAVLQSYVELGARLQARMLRLVLERDGALPTTRSDVEALLAEAVPVLAASGVRLAIENHFDVPSRVLAEAVLPYSPSCVGFCVDTANSLRNFEPTEAVFDLLGARAYCYHVKDYCVQGETIGFRVTGAPLGEGALDLDGVLGRILAHDPAPQIFVENWRAGTGDWETDVREDDAWLRNSLNTLCCRLSAMGRSTGSCAERGPIRFAN